MGASLADIAAHAGVSEATVSRVLNERPGVAPEKRQAVLTALHVLGYERPTRLSRRTGRPVGMILPELANPFYPALAQALGANFARRRFTPLLGAQEDGAFHEDEQIEMLIESGAAGIVFVRGRHSDTSVPVTRYQELRERGLMLGFVNGFRDGVDAPFFSVDEVAGMTLAVRHLVALGHRRIALANGPAQLVSSQRMLEGYRAALEAAVPDAKPILANSFLTDDGGISAARSLLASGCTAIVCASDLVAVGVLAEARRQGLEVPRDLSVIGFDDSPLARHSWPPLTTVQQPLVAMSVGIADAFVGEMNKVPASRSEYLFQPELVVRESTGAVPAA
jgi:DNA-binding LacI/PurR family transcriptional regulator